MLVRLEEGGVLWDVVRRDWRLFPGVESGTAGMLTLGVPEPLVDGPPGPLLGLGVVHSWRGVTDPVSAGWRGDDPSP